MSDSDSFSARHGFRAPEIEITIREDAPEDVRFAVVELATLLGISPSGVRSEICDVLLRRPDPNNWSEYPNVYNEVQCLIDEAQWYRVYDIAERLKARLVTRGDGNANEYEQRLNDVFRERGVGWAMAEGRIVARGSQAFQESASTASILLTDGGKATAARELSEALRDISRRPHADTTGAIQHAMAALECVARDYCGLESKTLGQILPALQLPKPLDIGVEKLWGFASEQGRHIREGREPSFADAELVVTVASAVCTYLARNKTPN